MIDKDRKAIPLSKTTKFIVDNRGKTVPTTVTGIPLIATNCIDNENLYPIYKNVRYISQTTYDEWFRSHPIPGDIILTLKGSQNGAVNLVPNPVDFVMAQDMVALRADDNIVDPHYLFAALRSSDVQEQIKSLDVSGVIPHLKKSDFDKLLIPYPDLTTQKNIGNIYFNICLKIDLLRRNSKTLYDFTKTLFHQWFVEEAENGWTKDIVGNHLTAVGGTTPDTTEPNYWNGSIAWTSPRDLSGSTSVFLNTTQRNITELGLKKIGSGLLPIGTVLLSSRAPIGYLCISNIPVSINQGYIACLCNKGISNWYIFCWIKDNMDLIINSANGSTFLEISKGIFRSLDFIVPPDTKMKKFDKLVEPCFKKILSNENQISSLVQLRDSLLPKLISGEVSVLS
jgi:type I restriction enzyme, S subunit